jgi:hypothetical protein
MPEAMRMLSQRASALSGVYSDAGGRSDGLRNGGNERQVFIPAGGVRQAKPCSTCVLSFAASRRLTERSSASTAGERARDGASRAGARA